MAVLVEGNTVIVRRTAIDERFEGGWALFVAMAPNDTLRFDRHFAAFTFMLPIDVRRYAQWLESRGLVWCDENDVAQDLVVACQTYQRFTTDCDWAVIEDCRLTANPERTIVCCRHPDETFPLDCEDPAGWTWEGSLSERATFIPRDQVEQRLIPLTQVPGTDTYLDRETDKVAYVQRSLNPGTDATS